jgi:hypothetical protein
LVRILTVLGPACNYSVSLVAVALENRDHSVAQRLSAIAGRVAAANVVDVDVSHGDGKELPQKRNADSNSRPQAPFPQFYREENQLVNIGYSKSERRSYEHRSPHEVVERLVKLLLVIGVEGKQFNTERILPPVEKALADVPSYQVYLCLAFLVIKGLVRKHGRSGYTISPEHAADLSAAVNAQWNALPAR